MATKVLVPLLGEGVEEVTVTKWLKQEGDSINELEPLLEVNTDKVDTEIPAPASGVVLKIALEEGTVAKVGEVLAVIGQVGEAVEGTSEPEVKAEKVEKTLDVRPETLAPQPIEPNQKSEIKNLKSSDLGFISPVVAKIAAEHGVDLGQVPGTGLNGRITKKDVLKYVESGEQRIESSQPIQQTHVAPGTGAHDTLVKHSTIRKQIAEHMVMSQHTSPHVLTVMEVDMSKIVAHRKVNKEVFAKDGVKLTFTAYFMQAIVAGLKAYPNVNSSWTDEGLLVHADINVGMATSLGEEGLIVPVIKGADELSLLGMARAVNDFANRARSKETQSR